MIPDKNYETVLTFVKVMPRKPAAFFLDTVYVYMLQWVCQSRECVYFLKFLGNSLRDCIYSLIFSWIYTFPEK